MFFFIINFSLTNFPLIYASVCSSSPQRSFSKTTFSGVPKENTIFIQNLDEICVNADFPLRFIDISISKQILNSCNTDKKRTYRRRL